MGSCTLWPLTSLAGYATFFRFSKNVLRVAFHGGGDCDDLIDQESLHELHEAEMKADAEVEMDESRPHREPTEKVFITNSTLSQRVFNTSERNTMPALTIENIEALFGR